MLKSNYWLKNGLINIAQSFLSVGLATFSFIFLVRILSKDQYGTWVLFLNVVSLVELGRNGLIQEGYVKFLTSSPAAEQKRIHTATLIINAAATLLIVLILVAIAPWLGRLWHSDQIVEMLNLYSIVFFVSGFMNQVNCIEKANFSFVGIFYSGVARQLIIFAYIFLCYVLARQSDLIELTYIQILGIVVATIIAFIFTRRKISFSKIIDRQWIKKILNFGKYTFGVSLSAVVANSIDQFMLGNMISKSATGSFNVAIRITNLVDIPTAAMANILFPKSSQRIAAEGNNAAKYLYEKAVGVTLAILIPIVLFLYLTADFLVPLLAGQKYSDVAHILRVTLLLTIFAPYGLQAGTILTSAGKLRFNLFIVIFNTILIIVLNYFFIPAFGIMGSAYASLIVTALSFVISQLYLRKHFGINFANPWIYAYKFYPEFYGTIFKRRKKPS